MRKTESEKENRLGENFEFRISNFEVKEIGITEHLSK